MLSVVASIQAAGVHAQVHNYTCKYTYTLFLDAVYLYAFAGATYIVIRNLAL